MFKLSLKKWILIFVLLVSNFIIGTKTAIAFFHLFFWFLLSLVVISLIWILVAYTGIRLSLLKHASVKVEEDSVLEIETVVKNNSFLPVFNLVLEDNLPYAAHPQRKQLFLREYLSIKASCSMKYNCLCSQRGRFKIAPLVVYFFDPFGIFFSKRTYNIDGELYVYPRVFMIKKFIGLTRGILPWFGIGTTRVSGDEDEIFGTREYKEGDPIKRIHWISTARKNRLIVKQFQRQTFFRATIIFNLEKEKDFGEGKEKISEYIIKIAASLGKHLIERDISLEIIAHAGEIMHIPFNKGPEHLEEILKFLTIAQAESRVGLDEIFGEFFNYIPRDSTLFVIMLDTDWEYLPAILRLEKKNVSVIPLVVVSSSFLYSVNKPKDIKIAPLSNLNPVFISRGDNLEGLFIK